jgi:phosphatidate cytidylyltransferase
MWKRIVTAIILAPAFLLALFYLPVKGVQVLLGLVFIGVIWEAASLSGFGSTLGKIVYVATLIIIGLVPIVVISANRAPDAYVVIAGVASFWWLIDIYLLARFSVEKPGFYGSITGRVLNTGLVLLSTWFAINALLVQDSRSPLLLVYIVVMVWVADSGAYFAGKFLGSHKLAVHVSPGKTIEGVIGGVVAVIIFSWIYASQVFRFSGVNLVFWLGLSIVVALISVVGDLNESALKRVMGKKDSGNIIPGHGGFFDRADAITAAVPVFYFGWRILYMGAGT